MFQPHCCLLSHDADYSTHLRVHVPNQHHLFQDIDGASALTQLVPHIHNRNNVPIDPNPPDPVLKEASEKSTHSDYTQRQTRDASSSSLSESISTPDPFKCLTNDAATQTSNKQAGMTSVATATDEILDFHPPALLQAINNPLEKSGRQSDISQEINDAIAKNNWSLASVLMDLQRCENAYHLQCIIALIVKHLKQKDPHLEQLKAGSKTAMDSLQTQAANIRSKCSRKILKRPSFQHQTSEANEHQRIADMKAITGEFYGKPSKNLKSIWITLYHIGTTDNFKEQHYISALLSIFKGLPLEQLHDLLQADKSFEEILSFLEQVYVTPEPASTLQKSVDLLHRHEGERINSFIARSNLQINLTHQTYNDMSDNAWRAQKELKLRDLATKNTFSHINFLEEESLLSHGELWDLDKILTIIKKAERDYLLSQPASSHDTQNHQITDELQDASSSEQMDLSSSDTEDEVAYRTNPMAPEARHMSHLQEMALTADKDTHDNYLFETHQPTPPQQPTIHIQTDNPSDYVKKHSFNWDGEILSIKERSQVP